MNNRLSSILRAFALAAIIIGFHSTARAQEARTTAGAGTGYSMQHRSTKPESLLDIDSSSCNRLDVEAYVYSNSHMYQMEYDTAKKFVEQCPHFYPDVAGAFNEMSGAVQQLGNYGQRRADYFAWLKSVLYLNTTDLGYFCACVEAIAGELPAPPTVWPDTGYNYPLSVYQWLIQNTPCSPKSLRDLYNAGRADQYRMWANDPTRYKLDTTLPTMQQLGLDSLLAQHFQFVSGVKPPVDRFGAIVPEFGVTENPFTKQTVLRFTMSEPAYVQEEVFNLLGVIVQSDGGRILDPGAHESPLDLTTAPSGTYYLRIMLGTGEVRTIKLVKE
jgi:hypothetical protein